MASPDNDTKAAKAANQDEDDNDDEYLRESAAAAAALRATLDPRVIDRRFCLETSASEPLNITCYGSSSSKTPQRYLEEARLLGYILAKRGHVCINGAGSFGCMAAMNDGVHAGEGHVRGVIHEMFLVDNGYYDVDAKTQKRLMRRGSSHMVFENAVILNREEQNQKIKDAEERQKREQTEEPLGQENEATAQSTGDAIDGKDSAPIREILVAGGPDLQERKKFLVANTDALIVLPGGPGTWDELWEMACARHLNLHKLPIVCVNVDGYYEPFREMLRKAHKDKLIHLLPDQIVRFADGAEDAVRIVEGEEDNKKPTAMRTAGEDRSRYRFAWHTLVLAFVAGAVSGIAISKSRAGRR